YPASGPRAGRPLSLGATGGGEAAGNPYGTSAARSRTLDVVTMVSRSSARPNRRSNSMQMVRCPIESHDGVLSIDESGPRSSRGMSRALAMISITACCLLSGIDWLLVRNASICIPRQRRESVVFVERRDHRVLARRDVLADDLQ